MTTHPMNNIPKGIFEKIGRNLHLKPKHPIWIIKNEIYKFFDARKSCQFAKIDNLSPVVSAYSNFDEVLVPVDHVSRNPNDTYYVNADTVLRCHTSAHQASTLRSGTSAFLVTGDVYRRDSIDATHYPVFHQMEGLRLFSAKELDAQKDNPDAFVLEDLKENLEGLAKHLFGDVKTRWVDAYFPFTDPSLELEIFFRGEWLEVLGCGVTQQSIIHGNGHPGAKAWAFGLGLERLAMILFDIPDIRLFWSNDERFLKQFAEGGMSTKFKAFSKYPPCYKDISFWTSDSFTENNFCELIRDIAGDLVEEVKLIDSFENEKLQRTSQCFRIVYRAMDRSLTDEEINQLQESVREAVHSKLHVELR